jgi:hypothetical protein
MAPCLIGMEACVGAHHLSRKLKALGHDARLMPAKYVRPYSKGQKNDFRDAEAIAEAVQRPTMKFVATKTAEQLDLQALHRVRERLVSQRTGITNQGVVVSDFRSLRGDIVSEALSARQSPAAKISFLATGWRGLFCFGYWKARFSEWANLGPLLLRTQLIVLHGVRSTSFVGAFGPRFSANADSRPPTQRAAMAQQIRLSFTCAFRNLEFSSFAKMRISRKCPLLRAFGVVRVSIIIIVTRPACVRNAATIHCGWKYGGAQNVECETRPPPPTPCTCAGNPSATTASAAFGIARYW